MYMQATTEVPKIKPQLGIHVMNIIKGSKKMFVMFMFGYLVDDIFPQSIVRKKKKRL